MTYQVSDTDLTTRDIRSHGAVPGDAVVPARRDHPGVTINLVAGLAGYNN